MLTPACVFLGASTSISENLSINFYQLAIVLLGAISAHICVNTFNEYFDYRSGLDAKTSRTPFSGGSGTLVENPGAARAVLYVALISLGITVVVGIYYVFLHGAMLLPLGLAGVLIILTYTQWLNRNPFLCLIAPGLGFGPLMVGGTHFVLTGEYSSLAFIVSLVPFFLVNNLLLLNQFPDIQADSSVGRKHFPITYGTRNSVVVYGIFALASVMIILVGINRDYLPGTSGIALVLLSISIPIYSGAWKYGENIKKLMPYLGLNVLVAVVTPIVLGLTLVL